ncbi:MAG: GrpB family protein [Candidatus Hydrogenedentes bacterium]|nr:GrpB family protein [Candidatus Hydrogenedentota bacterium]
MTKPFELLREIVIVPFDASWADEYRTIASALSGVFGDELFATHHVGSTAIAGMRAKPIIDVLIEVRDIERVDGFDDRMIALGYEPRGEFGIAGRRFFVKYENGVRKQHVHTFQRGHEAVGSHLDFRDYLMAHPDVAGAYARLKDALAEEFRDDIVGYSDGKAGFIADVIERAREERASVTRWES